MLALIDYGAGNLRSVHKALIAAGADDVVVTTDAAEVARADRIVLPGVGAFAACMAGIAALPGVRDALERRVRKEGAPFLGVCVGMQVLAQAGEEHGLTPGLGWIAGTVRALPGGPALRVPHMGWNDVTPTRDHPLAVAGEAYYLHGYALMDGDSADTVATGAHGVAFPAVVARANVAGIQFHPEKSQRYGLDLLARFLRWRP